MTGVARSPARSPIIYSHARTLYWRYSIGASKFRHPAELNTEIADEAASGTRRRCSIRAAKAAGTLSRSVAIDASVNNFGYQEKCDNLCIMFYLSDVVGGEISKAQFARRDIQLPDKYRNTSRLKMRM